MQFLGPTEKGCNTSRLSLMNAESQFSRKRSGMNESGRWKFEGERKAAQGCMTTTVYRLLSDTGQVGVWGKEDLHHRESTCLGRYLLVRGQLWRVH